MAHHVPTPPPHIGARSLSRSFGPVFGPPVQVCGSAGTELRLSVSSAQFMQVRLLVFNPALIIPLPVKMTNVAKGPAATLSPCLVNVLSVRAAGCTTLNIIC